ncbi:MAG: hypothetical protein HY259_10705, partial [Chloroflexi bacterium]|nr:hypothetical protein [Chloroflexota bacterium]
LSLIALPLGLAFFLGMLWFARNALIYGPTDWLALSRHRAVVAGQPTTIALYGDYLTAATVFFPILFRSFWGQFGWMGVVLDARIYDGLLAFSVFALLGLAIRFRALSRREVPSVKFRFWARRRRASDQSAQLILLLVWFGFVLAVTMGYSLEFFQAQGRYLFPALGAIAIGLALGLRQWIGLAARGLSHLTRRGIPRAVSEWGLMGALSAALIALDWICLYRYIIPALTVGR